MRRAAALLVALLFAALAPRPAAAWLVVHTWPWTGVADAAATVLAAGGTAVDAAVAGASVAEADPSVESVGRGAHPDADGEPTLDALVMDGDTVNVGAVGALRAVAGAAAAARLVLRHSRHSMLVGSQATAFATAFGGLPRERLDSNASDVAYAAWRAGGCQVRPGAGQASAPARLTLTRAPPAAPHACGSPTTTWTRSRRPPRAAAPSGRRTSPLLRRQLASTALPRICG